MTGADNILVKSGALATNQSTGLCHVGDMNI